LTELFWKFSNQSQEICKLGDWQRPYSRAGVRGLVLAVDETKSLLTIGANLHLIAEPHVVLDVLAGMPISLAIWSTS
jgi:hypothetical protein